MTPFASPPTLRHGTSSRTAFGGGDGDFQKVDGSGVELADLGYELGTQNDAAATTAYGNLNGAYSMTVDSRRPR